jgi:hypothetical protein
MPRAGLVDGLAICHAGAGGVVEIFECRIVLTVELAIDPDRPGQWRR